MSRHKRSFSGLHGLLPSVNSDKTVSLSHLPMREPSFSELIFGTVIWRIWPAVLLHTVFATIIVLLHRKAEIKLGIPNVMLTLLGVVIGFVISLRVSSGYDRYWWGRCAWSDIVKTSRTMSRLTWIHVPPRITKPTGPTFAPIPPEEIGQSMREKRITLELIEAFAVAVKHYVRGELGIYYEDLYHVVRPFHEHHTVSRAEVPPAPHELPVGNRRTPKRQHSIESYSQLSSTHPHKSASLTRTSNSLQGSVSRQSTLQAEDPIVPNITSYGANGSTRKGPPFSASRTSLVSSISSEDGERDPLLPSTRPGHPSLASPEPNPSVVASVASAFNPINWWRSWKANWHHGFEGNDQAGGVGIRWGEAQLEEGNDPSASAQPRHHRRRRAARQVPQNTGKHRPRVAGDGENLPLEIVRCMSEWLCILESRGTVGGNALGGMFGCVTAYEDILSVLERILTTPLPYTVWIYLLFLPFQLVEDFNWFTIPGTAVASLFYLGFIAAGDEIEQPFGYDENDLDLDMFCRDVIKPDIHTLSVTPFPNAPIGSLRDENFDINEASTIVDVSLGKHRI